MASPVETVRSLPPVVLPTANVCANVSPPGAELVIVKLGYVPLVVIPVPPVRETVRSGWELVIVKLG